MDNTERQQYIKTLQIILDETRILLGTTSCAKVAAACRREGQMEARLRLFMEQAFYIDKMRIDPTVAKYFEGVDDFTGFCATIDSTVLEKEGF